MTTTLVPSASELAQSFCSALSAAARAYESAERAFSDLRALADTVDCGTLPYRTRITHLVAHRWMDELLQPINAACAGIGQARLDSNSIEFSSCLPEEEGDRDFRCGHMTWTDYIAALVKANDFEGIARQLREQAEGLEDKGLQEAADCIAKTLNLTRYRHHADAGPQRHKRKVLFVCDLYYSYGSYDYSCKSSLHALAAALSVAEAETGMSGIADTPRIVENVIDRQPWNQMVPSRTRVAEHTAVPAIIYNKCVKFEFTPQDGDSLIAFLRLHASVPLWDSQREAA